MYKNKYCIVFYTYIYEKVKEREWLVRLLSGENTASVYPNILVSNIFFQ